LESLLDRNAERASASLKVNFCLSVRYRTPPLPHYTSRRDVALLTSMNSHQLSEYFRITPICTYVNLREQIGTSFVFPIQNFP
jgi:hypothetical protein